MLRPTRSPVCAWRAVALLAMVALTACAQTAPLASVAAAPAPVPAAPPAPSVSAPSAIALPDVPLDASAYYRRLPKPKPDAAALALDPIWQAERRLNYWSGEPELLAEAKALLWPIDTEAPHAAERFLQAARLSIVGGVTGDGTVADLNEGAEARSIRLMRSELAVDKRRRPFIERPRDRAFRPIATIDGNCKLDVHQLLINSVDLGAFTPDSMA